MHVDNDKPVFVLRENIDPMELSDGKTEGRDLSIAVDFVQVTVGRELLSNGVWIYRTAASTKIPGIARLT
jgi:hypothetical protein